LGPEEDVGDATAPMEATNENGLLNGVDIRPDNNEFSYDPTKDDGDGDGGACAVEVEAAELVGDQPVERRRIERALKGGEAGVLPVGVDTERKLASPNS
jgi:hypothetical protein